MNMNTNITSPHFASLHLVLRMAETSIGTHSSQELASCSVPNGSLLEVSFQQCAAHIAQSTKRPLYPTV